MKTLTSLAAQNRFGELLDTVQREAVLVTRRGRPIAVVLSPCGDAKAIGTQLLAVLRQQGLLPGDLGIPV